MEINSNVVIITFTCPLIRCLSEKRFDMLIADTKACRILK